MSKKIKTIIYIVVFIIVLVGITIFFNTSTTKEQNKVDKLNASTANNKIIEVNEDNFEKEILNSDKKVLIDFYATWCGPCKSLEPIIEEIANENDNIKVVEIDVDKCEELVSKYRIQAMPTLVVIENGKEINRTVGAIPKDKILELCGIE